MSAKTTTLAPVTTSPTPGLPDDTFDHDGLITKRMVRAIAFAYLRPAPGQLMWDVGAGSGAMAIEWGRAADGCRAIGLERNAVRAERARANAARLAPGRVEIRDGEAADLLADLPTPDAVFIGGGATSGVLDACWTALKPGGRIVAHGVTVETEELLIAAYRAHGGELSRVAVEDAEPLGRFTGWKPARTIMAWSAIKA